MNNEPKRIKLTPAAYREVTCQEASVLSRETYIPCSRHIKALVSNKDRHMYFMCDVCATHNVRNRGGTLVAEIELGDFK